MGDVAMTIFHDISIIDLLSGAHVPLFCIASGGSFLRKWSKHDMLSTHYFSTWTRA
jgi:hypothetical protein